MTNDDWLEIGRIVSPHGLKGELRVYPSSDFPERFEEPGQRWLKPPLAPSARGVRGDSSPRNNLPQPVELLWGRFVPGKGLYVVQLKGVDNRDQAEALRGYQLLVPASDRPELEEDEYHILDLIDLEVFNQLTGEAVGVVVDVIPAGNDLLKVKLQSSVQPSPTQPETPPPTRTSKKRQPKGKKKPEPATVLIPFVKAIAPVVDLENGRIEITPPAGLLEVNKP
ncbi:MAG: ribosome maturation factor RimM [Moorea sp. SIOASIH]|uniref:ribosome maturation factor RimM n=1 Tax=Moorena sp. SIOASIH TaxID=2607817 RepID=UPI0013BA9A3C|nr:ribosome maturation factor RimM [Moorena sp. SIOASIH]NEO40673.1 ribosome maturation factor RimM [Moorena sp. SIOASIH]NEO91317.1 ribosome maturation factor RimM [Moorena sp. SIO3G5]